MQLNSRSFSSGRAPRRRAEADPVPVHRPSKLARGAWIALAVMLLFAIASVLPSWFAGGPEPSQPAAIHAPAKPERAGLKTRFKDLFVPASAKRLDG